MVFRDELDIVHSQARSIDRYCENVETIYVVVNDAKDVASLIDVSQWGRYSDRVQILHKHTFGSYWVSNGWVSQQVLKLVTAAVSQAQHCVVLDAKTIFLRPMPAVVQGNKLAVGQLPVYSVFEPSRQIVNHLWNIDLKRQLGPGGVPFWFDTASVRAMIVDIESRTKQSFVSWFQDQGRLTEFMLYSGWIEYSQGLDCVALPSVISVSNLCHSEVNIADKKIAAMHHSHTASVHRRAWAELTADQQQKYQSLLRERLA